METTTLLTHGWETLFLWLVVKINGTAHLFIHELARIR
jgi:hypothetical protein